MCYNCNEIWHAGLLGGGTIKSHRRWGSPLNATADGSYLKGGGLVFGTMINRREKMILLYIGVGGALGAISRYLVASWVHSTFGDYFPWGTFSVNIAGCFLLGLLYTLSLETISFTSQVRALLTVGFLGSFTTFSTFSNETFTFFREGNFLHGSIYIITSVILGLVAVGLGSGVVNFF